MINGDHINKSNKYVTQDLNAEIKIDWWGRSRHYFIGKWIWGVLRMFWETIKNI